MMSDDSKERRAAAYAAQDRDLQRSERKNPSEIRKESVNLRQLKRTERK